MARQTRHARTGTAPKPAELAPAIRAAMAAQPIAGGRNSFGTLGGCEAHNRVRCDRCGTRPGYGQAAPVLGWLAFAGHYCDRQDQNPGELLAILQSQVSRYQPDGWVLLECHMMDSSRLGELTILPYGPRNTWQAIPDGPVSPRGLASDMSVVVGILPASEVQPAV